jgi:Uma2 family endonuclease
MHRLDQPLPPESRITYEDYRQLPEDGRRYEVVEGRLYRTPSPVTRHQRVLHRLELVLAGYLAKNPLGEIFYAPLDVVLSEIDVVQPDLIFIGREHASRVTEENIQGAPDLVVEIRSPGTAHRDLTLKRKLYGAHGVAEYWTVDVDADRVEVFRGDAGALTRVATLDAGDTLESPLFPGLLIDLAAVLAR